MSYKYVPLLHTQVFQYKAMQNRNAVKRPRARRLRVLSPIKNNFRWCNFHK